MTRVKYRRSAVYASGNPALHLIKITMRHNIRIKSSSRTFVTLMANRCCISRSEKLISSFTLVVNSSCESLDRIHCAHYLFHKNKNILFNIIFSRQQRLIINNLNQSKNSFLSSHLKRYCINTIAKCLPYRIP